MLSRITLLILLNSTLWGLIPSPIPLSISSKHSRFQAQSSHIKARLLTKADELFEEFKSSFKKIFDSAEEKKRRLIFMYNLSRIWRHNNQPSRLYDMQINEFSDLTDPEFREKYLENERPLLKKNEAGCTPCRSFRQAILDLDKFDDIMVGSTRSRLLQDTDTIAIDDVLQRLPKTLDWTLKGKVSAVKHQLTCQACHVFSATAALESAILLRFNQEIRLSEQEVIDCSDGFGNHGCVSGQPQFAFDYIKFNGINLEENYPYFSSQMKCAAPTGKPAFKQNFKYFKPELNVISLIEYLQYGPVVVNHYVSDDFRNYFSGIFSTADCYFQTVINHSALLVGYDLTAEVPYFKLKNSWGTQWGEKGFYKVAIGEMSYYNPGFCFLANNGYNVFPTYFV